MLVWASRQDGGIDGTASRAANHVRHVLDTATESGNTDAVDKWLQQQYHDTGAYPALSQSDQDAMRNPSFSGIEYQRCAPTVVVVAAFSARGTLTRLLVNGQDWGVAQGQHGCPTSLLAPAPWTVPTSVP